VGFPKANSACENNVGMVFEEGQTEEVLDLGAVDFLGPGPVKLLESFDGRKMSGGNASLEGLLFATLGFAVDEPGQIFGGEPLFLGGLSSQDLVVCQ